MLRVDVAITRSEQAHCQRFHIGHEHEAKPVWFEERPGFLQEVFRFQQVLDHRPKGQRVEALAAKSLFRKVAAYSGDAARLGVIQSRAADVRSEDFIATRKTLVQLKQKGAV